jgi:hypothetical protein
MARMARVVVPGLPHYIISLSPDRPADDDSDRASAYHRATAWGAGMDRGARRRLGHRSTPGKPGPKPRADRETKQEPEE